MDHSLKITALLQQFSKDKIGLLNKILYNLNLDIKVFVDYFVANEGIQYSMELIDECQDLKEYNMVEIIC